MASPVVAVRRSTAFAWFARTTRPLRRRIDLNYLYEFDLARPVPELKAEIPIEMTRAARADVEEAAEIAGLPLREKFLARLDDGMACFVAKVDGRVVAYNWIRYRSGEDEGDDLHLGPGEIYTYLGMAALRCASLAAVVESSGCCPYLSRRADHPRAGCRVGKQKQTAHSTAGAAAVPAQV